MHSNKRFLIPIIAFVLVGILAGWGLFRQFQKVVNGSLKASGTVEAVEIYLAPEISGKVAQILVEEGQAVKAGDPLFKLDDQLLSVQRQRAQGAVKSAQAGLKVAESGLESAKASLALAQANLDAAQTQYQLAVETVRRADERSRSRYWRDDVPYQFNLPIWYFDKTEQMNALQVEIDAAKEALDQERQSYRDLLQRSGYEELLAAEERLAQARASFEVAEELLDRAEAANDDDGDTKEDKQEELEPWLTSGSDDHAEEDVFEAAEDALEDAAQVIHDQAKAELEAAQRQYKTLLSTLKLTKEIQNARARLAVAIERYELAQDRLMSLYSGAESLELIAAQTTVKQAQAALDQAQLGVSQAEAKLEQAKAGLVQAQADLEYIETQLQKLTVYAPVDGVILSRNVEVGEVVQAGATIMTLGDLQNLTITVYVPEDQYGQIQLGMSAIVTADSFPGEKFDAVVTQIADKAEFTPRNVQTQEGRRTTVFAIQLQVTNVDNKLKPGMPADVAFLAQ